MESENAQNFNFFAFWWPKLVFLLIVWILEDIQAMPSASFDPGKEIVSVLKSVGARTPLANFFLGIPIYAYNGQTNHSHGFIFALELLQDIIYKIVFWQFEKFLKICLAVPGFCEKLIFYIKKGQNLTNSFTDWTKKMQNYSL